MKDVLTKIRSRGHWRVVIRPSKFVKERVRPLAELQEIVSQCSVEFRGWDFPHINAHTPINRGLDYVEQSTDWKHHIEFWRLYQSGQLFFEGCLWEDWKDRSAWNPAPEGWQPGQWLHIYGAVYTYTEICEFAARLALSQVGSDEVFIDVGLHGLKDRGLTFEDPLVLGFDTTPTASIPAFEFKQTYAKVAIVAAPRDAALVMAQQLFEKFGWDATLQTVREIQDRINRR